MAADAKVEDLLTKMRDAYKGVKSARLEVKTTLYEEEEKFESSTKVLFANPNKVSIELTPEDQESDEKITLFYRHDGKKMAAGTKKDELRSREYDDEEFPIATVNLETLSFWEWDKQLNTAEGKNMHDSELKVVEDVEWNGKKWTTLEESAKEAKVFVRYYIDPKTHLIWRTEVKNLDTMAPMEDVQVTQLETGVEIEEDEFKIED
ncbi:MAG TPA: hypothetical protein VGE01_05550 [Fimbriimonas sp.]